MGIRLLGAGGEVEKGLFGLATDSVNLAWVSSISNNY